MDAVVKTLPSLQHFALRPRQDSCSLPWYKFPVRIATSCSQLRSLYISGNIRLGVVPPELRQLVGLTRLRLEGVKSMPDSISRLVALRKLDLRNTYLQETRHRFYDLESESGVWLEVDLALATGPAAHPAGNGVRHAVPGAGQAAVPALRQGEVYDIRSILDPAGRTGPS